MLSLILLSESLSICRFRPDVPLPAMPSEGFWSITRTQDELSLVCPSNCVPDACERREDGWRAFRVKGTLDFSLVGILAGIASVLAEAGISIFALSTYDTDYVLVKAESFARALEALKKNG